jgi:glutathione S-transferase
MAPILYIGNKNYSSWSLRAWLALKWGGIAFEERVIPLGGEGFGKSRIPAVRGG